MKLLEVLILVQKENEQGLYIFESELIYFMALISNV